MKKFFSLSLLGLYLLRHFILKFVKGIIGIFLKSTSGLQKFNDNYAQDRILALTREEVAALASMQHCIRCGLCDAMCDNTAKLESLSMMQPSLLASTHSRNLPEAIYAKEMLSVVKSCDGCTKCFEICPRGVNIEAIIKMMDRLSKNNLHVI